MMDMINNKKEKKKVYYIIENYNILPLKLAISIGASQMMLWKNC